MSQFILPPKRDPYELGKPRAEYQLFNSQYFTSADVNVMLGDILIDEVTSLSFQLKEIVSPLFGFSSYTADAFLRGQRSVTGALAINFTNVGYLHEVMRNAPLIQYAGKKVEAKKNRIPLSPRSDLTLDEILTLYGKDSFEEIAEDYEKAIWGLEKNETMRYVTDPASPYFQDAGDEGFTIRIHYGPNWAGKKDPLGTGLSKSAQKQLKKKFYDSKEGFDKGYASVETIVGVQIGEVSKTISTSQQATPVQEVYGFVAKDVNASPM